MDGESRTNLSRDEINSVVQESYSRDSGRVDSRTQSIILDNDGYRVEENWKDDKDHETLQPGEVYLYYC